MSLKTTITTSSTCRSRQELVPECTTRDADPGRKSMAPARTDYGSAAQDCSRSGSQQRELHGRTETVGLARWPIVQTGPHHWNAAPLGRVLHEPARVLSPHELAADLDERCRVRVEPGVRSHGHAGDRRNHRRHRAWADDGQE